MHYLTSETIKTGICFSSNTLLIPVGLAIAARGSNFSIISGIVISNLGLIGMLFFGAYAKGIELIGENFANKYPQASQSLEKHKLSFLILQTCHQTASMLSNICFPLKDMYQFFEKNCTKIANKACNETGYIN